MSPEGEKELLELMRRIADHLAPIEVPRQRHTAVLGTATYTIEERERKALKEKLRGNSPKVEP